MVRTPLHIKGQAIVSPNTHGSGSVENQTLAAANSHSNYPAAAGTYSRSKEQRITTIALHASEYR